MADMRDISVQRIFGLTIIAHPDVPVNQIWIPTTEKQRDAAAKLKAAINLWNSLTAAPVPSDPKGEANEADC